MLKSRSIKQRCSSEEEESGETDDASEREVQIIVLKLNNYSH